MSWKPGRIGVLLFDGHIYILLPCELYMVKQGFTCNVKIGNFHLQVKFQWNLTLYRRNKFRHVCEPKNSCPDSFVGSL